eukprot:scaffold67198_cov50-Attheya_sp.AAC.10
MKKPTWRHRPKPTKMPIWRPRGPTGCRDTHTICMEHSCGRLGHFPCSVLRCAQSMRLVPVVRTLVNLLQSDISFQSYPPFSMPSISHQAGYIMDGLNRCGLLLTFEHWSPFSN